ncbi:DUF5979 domain-containing protein [Arcanobacterium phocae]|uniref:DUF5979 domain-containing protein n=1 Tax=Arcanobacterium phocae TaxID=131112 RepID=UPI001C0ED632|nr:DUF5979 domain-containing protein [Arcanobacterium phocae]
MKKIAKFASLILTVMLMFGSFSQVAQAVEASSNGNYKGTLGTDGALKIVNGTDEIDGWCINFKKVFPEYGKVAQLGKLEESAQNLYDLVQKPAVDDPDEFLARVKQVLKYAEDHESEITKKLARPKFGIYDKQAYYYAVQGAIWALTDKDIGVNAVNKHVSNPTDQAQFKVEIQKILNESLKITYLQYGTISIGIYKATDPKTQNIITKEKPKVNSFKVAKKVEGLHNVNGAEKSFEFSYQCDDKQNGTITVKGDGKPVAADKFFPIDTKCIITETGDVNVADHVLIKPEVQTITIAKEDVVTATFINKYVYNMASFKVKKTVSGDAKAKELGAAKTFEFSYTCGKEKGKLTVPGNGTPVDAGKKFPVGTTCSVEETGNADVEGYTLVKPAKQTLTIDKKDQSVEFAFVNNYTKVKPAEGTFQVKKTVTGLAGEAGKDKQFEFSYTCGKEKGKLTVPGNGTPVDAGKKFPVGTTCSVEETGNADVEGYTLVKPAKQTLTIDKKDQTVEFAFVNNYSPKKAKVTFSKVVAGQGKELAGASLKVVEGEKADGKVVYEWMSEGQAKVFGLKSGVYTMVEDQAPLGYEKAEAITFRVSFDKNGGKVEVKQGDKFVAAKDAKVVMEDKPSLTPQEPKLPKTGLEIGALGIISLALIAAGGLIIRRKKTL